MMRGVQRVVGFYSMMLPLVMIAGSLILAQFAPSIPPGVSLSDPGAQALVWSQAPSAIGYDHGIKGLITLLFGIIPYWIWFRSGSREKPKAQLGLAAGVLYGLITGLSLSLQAATMVFAARGIAAYPELKDVYGVIGDWAMSGGGLSHSLYTIAQLFLAMWLVMHSSLLIEQGQRWLGRSAQVLAVLVVGASAVVFASLMSSGVSDFAHMALQIADFLMMIWVAVLGFTWVRESFRAQQATAKTMSGRGKVI